MNYIMTTGYIQSTLVISSSVISNNRLSRRKNLVRLSVKKSGNKILWLREEIAPKDQFLLISTIFSVYIVNLRNQITYLFGKLGCSFCIFLSSANLICRSTEILKCFNWSLRLRDKESRLYVFTFKCI